MKANRTRKELELALIEPTLSVKRSRNKTKSVKDTLFNRYKIIGGNVQMWLNNPEKELSELEWRVLLLFTEQIYSATLDTSINPERFFTEVEIKKASQYIGNLTVKEDIELPLELENVISINNNQYITKIQLKTLAQMSSFLLNYNFDIQREAKKIVRGGETIREATLVLENVEEIRSNLKKGKQETTTIVINASAGTSDTGNELEYNQDKQTLIINEGTVLDIVDGYHRCRASELVINENPNVEFEFIVLILNYTDDMAMNYQGQFAKQTPIKRTRQKQLSKPRHADEIVDRLSKQSLLKDKITVSSVPNLKNGELVSYDVITNTIDEEFDLNRVIEVHKVGEYLKNFFNILLEAYPQEFLEKPLEEKKVTIINENNMFIGYIILAKRMYSNKIQEISLIDYISKINMDRNNPLWKEIGVLNEKGNLNETRIVKQAIKDYFNSIEL